MIFAAEAAARRRAHDERMHAAWHTAALIREAVGGLLDPNIAMTPLANLLADAPFKAAAAPKTADELQQAFVAWLGAPPEKTGD